MSLSSSITTKVGPHILAPFLDPSSSSSITLFLISLLPYPSSMKRPLDKENDTDARMKRKKHRDEEGEESQDAAVSGTRFVNLDENLLYEVLKHVDERTLGRAACVNKQWHRTTLDERLWELICTRHWANIGCGNDQLRSVVLALGGFRRLHLQYLWPLSKPQSSNSSAPGSSSGAASSWAPFPAMIGNKPPPTRWGKDEVHLSLSLLSIRYYEKMNFRNRGR